MDCPQRSAGCVIVGFFGKIARDGPYFKSTSTTQVTTCFHATPRHQFLTTCVRNGQKAFVCFI